MMSAGHHVVHLGLLHMTNFQRWFLQLRLYPSRESSDFQRWRENSYPFAKRHEKELTVKAPHIANTHYIVSLRKMREKWNSRGSEQMVRMYRIRMNISQIKHSKICGKYSWSTAFISFFLKPFWYVNLTTNITGTTTDNCRCTFNL